MFTSPCCSKKQNISRAKRSFLFGCFRGSKNILENCYQKELDPWTVNKQGECLLGILIKKEAFVLAKALVDVACEEKYTQSETEAVLLLNSVCKEKSTKTHWKVNLVQDILKSRKCPTTASTPLRLCCKNIIETGVFDGKREDETDLTGEGIHDDEPPPNKKQRMDESSTVHKGQKDFQKNPAIYNSVHYKIMNLLLSFGADSRNTDSSGESCLDIAETCPALKEFLMKPIDIKEIPQFIPWTSVSKNYEDKLAKVARRQECEVVNQFWYHEDHIGSGSFGHVFAGINEKDGREVAIKRIETLRIQRPEDKREITNLTHLADCEQVVRYLLFFQDEKFSYIVLELMEGNLDECLNVFKLDTQKRNKLCKDVVMGVQYLHKQNILHRDLKPSNILYKTHPEQCLKIADFGLSRRIDSISTTVYGTNAGTRCWIAPEVLKSIATVDHSKSSDMFSCGLLLHYILSDQKHPFSPADCESKSEMRIVNETEANIINSKMEGWDNSLSPEATHLVTKILESDEKKRLNAGEALDHLLFWSQEKKIDLLTAVGNQPVFEYPRAGKSTCLTAVEADLEKSFSTIVRYGKWDDPRYSDMPAIYAEMTQKRKSLRYRISSRVSKVDTKCVCPRL